MNMPRVFRVEWHARFYDDAGVEIGGASFPADSRPHALAEASALWRSDFHGRASGFSVEPKVDFAFAGQSLEGLPSVEAPECDQEGCSSPAVYVYDWPGAGTKHACPEHGNKAAAVARAMGLELAVVPLELAPVDDELERADTERPPELDTCPGERQCFARGGSNPCRAHGCRACGGVILADTENWPAPLCPAHAPEDLFDFVDALRALVVRHVQAFDRMHSPDCRVWLMHPNPPRPPADDELDVRPGQQGPCSCGATALREDARELLGVRNRFGNRVARRSPEKPS